MKDQFEPNDIDGLRKTKWVSLCLLADHFYNPESLDLNVAQNILNQNLTRAEYVKLLSQLIKSDYIFDST